MIITDEMVERVWRERTSHPKPHSGFRAALEAFANDIIGACGTTAAIHSQYPIENDFDRGYDKARKDAASAIRALKSKPWSGEE